MKKLFLILLLVVPLPALADDVNVCAGWNPYPTPSPAIKLKVNYRINGGDSVRLGTVGSDQTRQCKVITLNPGDELCGYIWAQRYVDGVRYKSPKSPESCVVYTPELLTPEGLMFVAPDPAGQ